MPRPPRSKNTSRSTTTKGTLALSSVHQQLQTLEAEHQLLLKKIKTKRKELDNLVDSIRNIATEMAARTSSYMKNLYLLDEKIHALFKEILSGPKLGKQTKKKVERVYFYLQMKDLIRSELNEDEEDEDEDEDFFAEEDEQFNNTYSDFSSENGDSSTLPSASESTSSRKSEEYRHMRQIFLKLAENFHPDKVTDSETQSHYTEIMKELNRAYQERDLARLLEIEKQHSVQEKIDINSEDDLTRRCQAVEKENQLLKQQYEHILTELNMFKQTPEGELVRDYRKAKKEKVDLFDSVIQEMQEQIDMMQEIYEFVESFKNKKITISQFVKGPEVIARRQQELMEELMEEMLDGVSFSFDD